LKADEVEPFKVFISSSQKEFEKVRSDLKTDIDRQQLAYQRIFKAILVEYKKGPSIPSDIDEGINDCVIYVGIFGRIYSEITVEEFKKAKSKKLPILVYRFRKDKRMKSVISGNSKVDKFLREEVKYHGIRIRIAHTYDELISTILTDLAFQVAEMVKECADVRKTISR
jgi:hypothetical protein